MAVIYKELAKLIGHVYLDHYEAILHLGLEGHMNTATAHFLYFGIVYTKYLETKDVAHIEDLVKKFEAKNWKLERDQ